MRRFAPLFAALLFLFGCGGATQPAETPPAEEEEPGFEQALVLGDDACETDADCVPAACCHAAACVSVDAAPACGEAICTTDCRDHTIDCGGGCLCHEGHCAARVVQMNAPEVQ